MESENDNTNHLEILAKSFKDIFETFVDDETKDFINDVSNADPKEKINLFSKYIKDHEDSFGSEGIKSGFSFRPCGFKETCDFKSDARETCDEPCEFKESHVSRDPREPNETDIDDLVKQKRDIESKIDNLSEEDKIDFWVRYHNIPNDVNEKLDVLISTITTLNSNVNERFDDINTDITILKKHMHNK